MDVQAMMQQAKQMQERLQQRMAEMRIEGNAGGGMVKVEINGSKQLRKADDQLGQSMTGLLGGLKIPGLS
jgi:DNA-binding protein YbaB